VVLAAVVNEEKLSSPQDDGPSADGVLHSEECLPSRLRRQPEETRRARLPPVPDSYG
jgi:hypothetical protein